MLKFERDPTGPVRPRLSPGIVSAAAHIAVLLSLAGMLHRTPKIAPYKLPGTPQGTTLLTYYAAGSPEHSASEIVTKAVVKPKLLSTVHPASEKPMLAAPAPANAEQGSGHSEQRGLGDGEINMAQLTHFPHPRPDLSSLPRGTQGDVVLNAVIDEHGRIASLTLLKGLGEPIDDQVIAAVREWTYSPATKNGAPVPSEQELHFHYERA